MWDLSRHNEFAWKTATGRYMRIDYSDAWARLKRNQYVYERVMPNRGVTRAEKTQIPWTLIEPPDGFAS